jgi:nucleolar protein 6
MGCSAGGGGSKSEARKAKLKAKNERLNEQRWRKAVEIEKEKSKKGETTGEAESGEKGGAKREKSKQRNPLGRVVSRPPPVLEGTLEDIHPSRRAMLTSH